MKRIVSFMLNPDPARRTPLTSAVARWVIQPLLAALVTCALLAAMGELTMPKPEPHTIPQGLKQHLIRHDSGLPAVMFFTDPNGLVQGPYVTWWHDTLSSIKAIGTYRDGKKDGVWILYPQQGRAIIEEFRMGTSVSIQEIFTGE